MVKEMFAEHKLGEEFTRKVEQLFELEVPEISDGLVKIIRIAREEGVRCKIAVAAADENIDAVGTCVGPKGSRARKIAEELEGEKLDIVTWNPNPAIFIGNALRPAQITKIILLDEEAKDAQVIVPDDELTLAIGRKEQNARLAEKLTGWRIEIKSESQSSSPTTK